MKISKIDHVAIAVKDLEEACQLYNNLLGKNADSIEVVEDQKVRAAFFSVDDTNLELLEPTSPESPIAKFLEKNPRGGLHHICMQVTNLEEHLARLKAQGVMLIDETPRQGAHNKRIAFVHPKSTGGVLIELSEAADS